MPVDRKEYVNKIPTDSGKILYLDAETADVFFIIGSDKSSSHRIPAHKNLLAAASDVFKKMFYGPLKERGDVIVDGANAAAFDEFLQFFYIDNVELTIENVAEVMDLGHKYNVIKCFDLCVEFIKDTLTDDNICNGLSLAFLYDHVGLRRFCDNRIIVNTSAVLKSANFIECDRHILTHILNINLFSCPETEVLEACMAWVKAASKQENLTKELVQAHLGELFYNIRFASMKMKDVATLTGPYGFLFSFDEYKEIIQMIELPIYQPTIFKAKPREIPWNKGAVVVCDRSIANRPNTFPRSMRRVEVIAFSTNEPILLGSLICTSLIDQRGKESTRTKQLVEVTIVEISGVDIPDSDDDDENILEMEPFLVPARNNSIEPSSQPSTQVSPQPSIPLNGGNNTRENSRTMDSVRVMQQAQITHEEESSDDDEEEPNAENDDDNDDDYDLIFEKTISNLKVYLRSKSRTKILLSKPVLIRPGFLYEIRIQQTPLKHCYNAKVLKTRVQLDSGVTIRFHPDSLHNIKRYGLVTALEFNSI